MSDFGMSGTIFDNGLTPDGWDPIGGVVKFTPYGSHTSQYYDNNYRVSWDDIWGIGGQASVHWTNQSLSKHHPDRHLEPQF